MGIDMEQHCIGCHGWGTNSEQLDAVQQEDIVWGAERMEPRKKREGGMRRRETHYKTPHSLR